MKNHRLYLARGERRDALKLGATLLTAALVPASVFAQLGAANRNAERMRRNVRRRHSVVSYHTATNSQRAAAVGKARQLQAKTYQKWERTPNGKAYAKANGGASTSSGGGLFKKTPPSTTPVKKAPMSVVVRDMKVAPVQGVKVPPAAAGSRTGVMAVDLRTGGLAGNGVVEMASAPRAGGSVSQQVKAAVEDGTIQGNPNEFLRTDVVLASL